MPTVKKTRRGKKKIMDETKEEVLKVICSICLEEVDADDMKETEDGTELCSDCYKDEGICYKCSDCDSVYVKEEDTPTKVDGSSIVCQSCLDDDYFHCEECETWYKTDEMCEGADGESVCQSCYDDKFGQCECGNTDRQDEMTYFHDRYYCQSCRDEELSECDSCGNMMYRDDGCYNEENDECLCSRCQRRATASRVIHDYSFQPDYKFYQMKEEEGKKSLYLGLELEVEGNSNEDIAGKAKRLIEWMKEQKIDHLYYMKSDGSLDNGFEICAMPMTLKYIKKHAKVKETTEWMRNNGLSSYKKGTCGFHIHMSRSFFRNNDIGKMRGFFSSCHNQIFRLSKRGEASSFAMKENYGFQQYKEGIGQSGRYWTLNCNTHKATYEVRIFRGTLNHKRLMASIEFVQAVSEYIQNVGFLSMFQVGKLGGDIWRDFLIWCKRDGRFQQFHSYYMRSCTR